MATLSRSPSPSTEYDEDGKTQLIETQCLSQVEQFDNDCSGETEVLSDNDDQGCGSSRRDPSPGFKKNHEEEEGQGLSRRYGSRPVQLVSSDASTQEGELSENDDDADSKANNSPKSEGLLVANPGDGMISVSNYPREEEEEIGLHNQGKEVSRNKDLLKFGLDRKGLSGVSIQKHTFRNVSSVRIESLHAAGLRAAASRRMSQHCSDIVRFEGVHPRSHSYSSRDYDEDEGESTPRDDVVVFNKEGVDVVGCRKYEHVSSEDGGFELPHEMVRRRSARKLFSSGSHEKNNETSEQQEMYPKIVSRSVGRDLLDMSYLNSQEPGEETQVDALTMVDKLVWLNGSEASQIEEHPVALEFTKGRNMHIAAKGIPKYGHNAVANAYDWIDSQPDEVELTLPLTKELGKKKRGARTKQLKGARCKQGLHLPEKEKGHNSLGAVLASLASNPSKMKNSKPLLTKEKINEELPASKTACLTQKCTGETLIRANGKQMCSLKEKETLDVVKNHFKASMDSAQVVEVHGPGKRKPTDERLESITIDKNRPLHSEKVCKTSSPRKERATKGQKGLKKKRRMEIECKEYFLHDILLEDGCRRKREMGSVRVLFSHGLSEDTLKHKKKVLAKLGGHVATSATECTHFIVEAFTRSCNMLEAIAAGKAVVTSLWLDACAQARYFMDEKPYILRDEKKEKEFRFSMPSSLAAARQKPLLMGYKVVISPSTKPPPKSITAIVEAAGAKVLVEDYGDLSAVTENSSHFYFVISCEEDYKFCIPFLEKGLKAYSEELLLSGVVTQKLDFQRNQIFTEVGQTRCTSKHTGK